MPRKTSPKNPKPPNPDRAASEGAAARKARRSPAAKKAPKPSPTPAGSGAASALDELMAAAGEEADASAALASVPGRSDLPPRAVPWNRIGVDQGHNPRRRFDDIEDLAKSIEAQDLIQPLTVRSDPERPGYFLLVAGERRWRAVELLVKRRKRPADAPVPVSVRDDLDARGVRLTALAENLQRSDLSPLEEAEALAALREPPFKLSAQKLANLLGKSRRHVLGRLQLLRLVEPVREALETGEISFVIARALGNLPEKLQHDALAHYRTAHPQMRTEEGIRNWIASRAIPVERALFDPEVYVGRHKGPVYEGEGGKRYFLDVELFHRLQEEEVEARKRALAERREWVEVIQGYSLPSDFERDPEGPGAVILVPYNLVDIEVIDGVRPAAPAREAAGPPPTVARAGEGMAPAARARERAPAAGPSAAPSSRPAPPAAPVEAPAPEPPAFVKAPTRRRCATAARFRNRALQRAVQASPETALRLAIAGMLTNGGGLPGRGASVGVQLSRPPHDQQPGLPPEIEGALGSLASFLGFGSTADDLLSIAPYNLDERDVYEKLLRAALPQLERMHRALVALTVGAWYPSARDATPATSELLVRVARDLDVEVTDWEPTEEYLAEYTTEELRAIGDEVGVPLPKSGKKKDLVEALLASGRLNRYTPPELYFRASA